MDYLTELLKRSPEYQQFGMNALTVSALGATIFTFLQGWGVRKLGNRIWETRSGDSVSVIFIGYSMLYFFAFIVYGAQKLSITMTFNGLLALLHIRIMRGLLKFKGFTSLEWFCLVVFGIVMIPGMFFFHGEKQELFLLVLLFGILATLVPQTYGLWKSKSVGALDPRYLYVFLATNVFWFTYAAVIGSWSLMIFNPIAFIFILINLRLYYKYRRKEAL